MTVIDTRTLPHPRKGVAPPNMAAEPADVGHSAHWAAKELLLTRSEFEHAVLRGLIATVPGRAAGGRLVTRGELDRVQATKGFPGALRERVRVVGTAQAGSLLGIANARFTRLARAGLVAPAGFRLNRYRSLVWHYFAEEVRGFGAAHPELLTGRAPAEMSRRLRAGEDLRAARWRDRLHQHRLGLATTHWERAAVTASFLAPAEVADVLTDPHERALLNSLRQMAQTTGTTGPGAPPSPADLLTEHLMEAREPEEVRGYRVLLALSAAVARTDVTARASRRDGRADDQASGSGAHGRNRPSCTTETSRRPSRS
ncbi:DUF6397 family protein [Streptomyces sp. KLOTTS4A1]|uniref:DUF6397 family protein n=1 Tax=Streptomyces sp. KLOTTS4A1 TaxID=3390996 RepID=UPI0039F607D1